MLIDILFYSSINIKLYYLITVLDMKHFHNMMKLRVKFVNVIERVNTVVIYTMSYKTTTMTLTNTSMVTHSSNWHISLKCKRFFSRNFVNMDDDDDIWSYSVFSTVETMRMHWFSSSNRINQTTYFSKFDFIKFWPVA